jgi:hypothetical protein
MPKKSASVAQNEGVRFDWGEGAGEGVGVWTARGCA